jgi:hypothetical protein
MVNLKGRGKQWLCLILTCPLCTCLEILKQTSRTLDHDSYSPDQVSCQRRLEWHVNGRDNYRFQVLGYINFPGVSPALIKKVNIQLLKTSSIINCLRHCDPRI